MKNKIIKASVILILLLFDFAQLRMNGQIADKKQYLDIVYVGNSITQGLFLKHQEKKPLPQKRAIICASGRNR